MARQQFMTREESQLDEDSVDLVYDCIKNATHKGFYAIKITPKKYPEIHPKLRMNGALVSYFKDKGFEAKILLVDSEKHLRISWIGN